MRNTKKLFMLVAVILALVLSACSNGASSEQAQDAGSMDNQESTAVDLASLGIDCSEYSAEYAKGPNGEDAVPASDVTLSDEEIAEIQAGNYTAALLWAGAGEWYNGLTDGAQAVFEELGIAVVATSDAQFDPAKQATDVETALALQPDIILTLPVDPVSAAQAFQPAVDQGVALVFADNGVDGYAAGDQYIGIVTGNHYGMGRGSADLMAEALGGSGEIGFIFYDADYFVTNNRDFTFACRIAQDYPDIKIVAVSGFTEESKTEEVASAMLVQHPEIDGIYVAWDVAAEGVIAALRSAGQTDVKVVTEDLGANNDLDMVMNGNMYGKTIDLPYDIGATMARMAAYKLLGKEAPSFVVVDLMKVTKDNIVEAWNKALNMDPPQDILDALAK
ncbi:MAG: substrate-binding domain-containing protein [Chloroflexi bacterium]|nr:substrate-binding domain-containing protein [Chloroflexota bacterium]